MTDFDRLPMRLAVGQLNQLTDEAILFAKQLGIQDIQFNMYHGSPHLPGETHWEYMDLLKLRTRCEDAGLRLNAIENVPIKFYIKAMLGEPGRDEQIEHMQTTIRNMGRAGIPIFGYHWAIDGVWRTSTTTLARGGAHVTAFDYALVQDAPLTHGRPYSDEEIWDNYIYYMKAILPVAEEAGVKLALHPDDPPVPTLAGVGRIMRSYENFKKAMEVAASPNHGLDFCVGSWSEMDAEPGMVLDAIRHFGSQGKVFYVHFRDVLGQAPKFREAFINEGNLDMFEVMQTLHEVGFTGFLLDDHVPMMSNDSGWNNRSRSFALGQMSVMLDQVLCGRRVAQAV
ncbi:MAG: mannonate dehydratase [Caldilineaceae bacterium]|nr:mannonate dehydratase [Caldilineaceae bacterium]